MYRYKKIIIAACLMILIGTSVLVKVRPVNAQFTGPIMAYIIQSLPQTRRDIFDKINDAWSKVQGWVGADLANRTVEMFMNDLAYNVATEIATGGTGGTPLFRTESIEKSLQHAQEAAVGEFIGQLSSTYFADLGLDLCEPSLEVKLTLTLSLINEQAPPQTTYASRCNWTNVKKRWESFGNQNFAELIKFQLSPQQGVQGIEDYFKAYSLEQSDLGVFAKLQGEINNRKAVSVDVFKLTEEECKGFKDKATAITLEVKTHCAVILKMTEEQWTAAVRDSAARIASRKEAATNRKLTDIMKDAASNFANTLSSKLLQKWIKGGMWSMADIFGNDDDFRGNLLDQLRGGGDIRNPRGVDVFTDFKNIKISPIESYSFLNDFSICPEEIQYRKPDNCVMSTDLLQAISNKLTIKESVENGILNGAWQFINPSDTLRNNQECYKGAFCYNNLVKLRKANIIPVGWEMVSQRSDLVTPVTLRQVMDCFEDEKCPFPVSPDFIVDGEQHNPFYHLVDPNWVLKAPQAYCSAYVYSPLLDSPETDTRQQYCADAQVCLREDENGNCLDNQYGYCTKSENIWRLGADQCDQGDIYSGCLNFDNPEIGQESYLEQSLSYCTADQAGCKRYSQEMNQENNWVLQDINTDDNDLFLNRQAQDCPSSEAGCHEYIVMAADRGINIVANGSLSDLNSDNMPDGWLDDNGDPSDGVEYDSTNGRVANGYSYGPGGYAGSERFQQKIYLLPNTTYTISASAAQHALNAGADAEVRVSLILCDNTGNCSDSNPNTNAAGPVPGLGDCHFPGAVEDIDLRFVPDGEEFQRDSCTFTTNQYTAGALLNLLSNSTAPALLNWFDDIKVEMVSSLDRVASPYSDYGSGGKITMNDTRFMCTADELGCQGYTPTTGGVMIPAVVNPSDLCPAECVGYASFAETPSIFSVMEGDVDAQYYNFIPNSAQSCPASAIGCEEFTNLDEVAQGGEGKEYFTYIRQCVAENLGTTYYTWEGSDTAGYQIRTWQILVTNAAPEANGSLAPCTNVAPGGETCLDNSAPQYPAATCSDADVNPNCRQFFDTDGRPSYRLQDRVIYASSDCHEYRRTASGEVYKTIPSLSIACGAEFDGCHLYTGNTANNVREIFSNNFEQGTFAPWASISNTVSISSESLENGGHSIKLNSASNNAVMYRPLSNISEGPRQYKLSWWMKNDLLVDRVEIMLSSPGVLTPKMFYDPNDSQLRNISAGDWHYFSYIYTADPSGLNLNDLRLNFTAVAAGANVNVYFDNIILKEVGDNISVVRNSWETPIACDSPYVGYHLGCQSYTDTNNKIFNLRSFSNLCRVDAIGCSAVIDTQNSTYPFEETFNAGNAAEITVPADNLAYLVPDNTKYCSQDYKGCQALGLPDRNNPYLLNTVYKINNPDQYASTLCNSDGLGCEEFSSDKGTYYFRDPGSGTCTYQTNVIINGISYSGWFKTTSLNTDNILGCSDSDGVFDTSSIDEDGDDLAFNNCVWATADGLTGFFRKDSLLTVNPVGCWPNSTPGLDSGDLATDNLAANCPAEKNLCTTLRDPSDPETCDPSIDSNVLDGVCRNIADGHILDFDSRLGCEGATDNIDPDLDGPARWIPACQEYYYYNNSSIDQRSCAGGVDKNGGCVLLYDANYWQSNHEEAIALYDSGKTYDENLARAQAVSPVVCDPDIDGSCSLDANMLVKVKKDRQCSEWLACRSSTAVWDRDSNRYKTVCDDVSACTEYDRNNNVTKCSEWAAPNPALTVLSTAYYQNRDTGTNDHLQWSDEEYLGYSLPSMLPVKDLVVNTFDDGSVRAGYPYFDNVTNDGNFFAACRNAAGTVLYDGLSCSVSAGGGVYIGECDSGYCWLNPKINDTSTSTMSLSTRGYAAIDAPFPHSIFPAEENQGALRSYSVANYCQNDTNSQNNPRIMTPNGCEQSYRKVTYGASTVRYYPKSLPQPNAICTAGKTDVSGNNSVYSCNNNAECNTVDNNGVSQENGLCEKYTKIENINNWSGICLSYDYNNQLIKDTGNDYYCNQWYPAEQISGTNSLYENYQEAGYYNPTGQDALFCAATEDYVLPETRYYCVSAFTAGAPYNIQVCAVLAKVPAGTKIHLRYMDSNFNNTPALTTLVSGYLKNDPQTVRAYGPNDTVTDGYSGQIFNGVRRMGWESGVQSPYTGLGVSWLYRNGADPLFTESNWNQNWRTPLGLGASLGEYVTGEGSSLFLASDFDSTGTLGLTAASRVPVLPLNNFNYIFDADALSTGLVELYFYDSYINREGNWGESAIIWPFASQPGQDYFPIGTYKNYGVQKTEDEVADNLEQCQPGWHESWFNAYLDGDFNNTNVGGWDQRGWNGHGRKEEDRWCSPMAHGIYVKPAFPAGVNNTVKICEQENCSYTEGLAAGNSNNSTPICLSNEPYYSNINVSQPCNGNVNCDFKNCVNSVGSESHNENGTMIYWCSDFGEFQDAGTLNVDYECPGNTIYQESYDNYVNVSGCLDIIYNVATANIPNSIPNPLPGGTGTCTIIGTQNQTYGSIVLDLSAGANSTLDREVGACMTPIGDDAGAVCSDIVVADSVGFYDLSSYRRAGSRTNIVRTNTPYDPEKEGADCGNDCYQQCRLITQLDAAGDKTWVRTDMWWRYSRANDTLRIHNTDPNDWLSYYYRSSNNRAIYQLGRDVYYFGVSGQGDNLFTHFGAALDYFNPNKAVITRMPASQIWPQQPSAVTFFSSSTVASAWPEARSRMTKIFANVYNLNLVNGTYIAVSNDGEFIDDNNPSPNTYAGDDYKPRALKVCGDTACAVRRADQSIAGYQSGITINEEQDGIISSQESLFVAVKAYFYAHPDHMPVVNIRMDWDDSRFSSAPGRYKNALFSCKADQPMPNICTDNTVGSCDSGSDVAGLAGFGGLDNACRQGYKIFYHDYQYTNDPTHSCAANGVAGQAPNAACFKPKMYIVDRWGLGDDTLADAIPFDGWIVVNP